MTSEEIQNIIKSELANETDFFNPHGIDFKTNLIKPIKQIYHDPLDNKIKYDLWTVLEETPNGDGYKIFYSEEENAFGLGIKSKDKELTLLGIYGPFLTTVSCM
jgi:hypothetical protein